MTRVPKLILVMAALGAPLASSPAGAQPSASATRGLSVAPATRYVVAKPPSSLTPTTVSNATGSGYQVSVVPVLLTQSLTGGFHFSPAPRNLAAAKLVLTPEPASFALVPGRQQRVILRWNALPRGKTWVAAGVVLRAAVQPQKTTHSIITTPPSVNFMRLPGPVTVRGIFTDLLVGQFRAHVLRFVARVENTGGDFTTPANGLLTIRDASHRAVFTRPWTGIPMLPGATVDFPVHVQKILGAGNYTATVTMSFGGLRHETVPFRLAAANQLPRPEITIQSFHATGTIGSSARVTAKVINSGTAPASVNLHLYLSSRSATPGQHVLAADTIVYRHLAPGSVTALSHPVGGALKQGSYRAVLTWTDPTGTSHSLRADFTAIAGKSWLQKVWDYIKHHAALFIGLLVLLLLLIVVAYVYSRQRRRKRREAELAAARAAVESAASGAEERVAALAGGGVALEQESEGSSGRETSAGSDGKPEAIATAGPGGAPGPDTSPENDEPTPGPGANGNPGPDANPERLVAAAAVPVVPARREPPPVPSPAPGPAQLPSPPAPAPGSSRRTRRRAVTAAAVGLGVAGAVAVIRWRNRR